MVQLQGDQNGENLMLELLSIKQLGIIFDYHDQFKFLLGKVDLTDELLIFS